MHCVIKIHLVLRNFVNKPTDLNKIQFNSFYINMWLSSSNIFEENQFYEIKGIGKHLVNSFINL